MPLRCRGRNMRRRVAALNNGKLFTRLLLATADCREGYARVPAQIVQAYAPVGTAEFGDGRRHMAGT